IERMVKEPGDLRKLLSVRYVPLPFDGTDYWESERELGERAAEADRSPPGRAGLVFVPSAAIRKITSWALPATRRNVRNVTAR
ncbi:hypothetical protein HQ520_10570, partial [bacterium]|nr:hypothetical protein [bacterium]